MKCVHCQQYESDRPRGLCWRCYYQPGVRESTPRLSPIGNGALGYHNGTVPVPTEAEPGSAEKIEVMRQRVLRGEQIFHPLDGLPLKRMRLAMEELRKLADQVQQMRVAQRAYFRKRTSDLLEVSKRLEREVDEAVKAILDQTHPTLFDQLETAK